MKKITVLSMALIAAVAVQAKFVEGAVNKGWSARFKAPLPEKITPAHGAAEMYFKMDSDFADMKPTVLMSSGKKGAGWWYIRFKDQKISFSVELDGQKSSSITVDAPGLKGGEWHHLAVSWGVYKGKGFARIYINGRVAGVKEEDLPEKFAEGDLCLLYNNAYYAGGKFPGAIDEFAIYDIPLADDYIAKRAADKTAPAQEKGLLVRYSFDDNKNPVTGSVASEEKELKKALKNASKKVKVGKYADELPFVYRFESPMPEEKTPGTLNDGNDNTAVNWRNRNISIICELDQTYDITNVELYCKKHTKWYILKSLEISFDDGSGEFGNPDIVKCYGKNPVSGSPDIDDSCKGYVYNLLHTGKACRIRIKVIGDAYMSIGEIRIRGKK